MVTIDVSNATFELKVLKMKIDNIFDNPYKNKYFVFQIVDNH